MKITLIATYASLRAGLPTLICSVFADQPFWGSRCRALGVGDTLPFKKLDAKRLARGLERVLNDRTQVRARALGARLEAERGVDEAVEVIEKVLPRGPHPV